MEGLLRRCAVAHQLLSPKFLHATPDIRVRVYGDAAVVTGRLQRTRVLNEKEVSDDWRFTKTYVRQAEKWRVVAFHASEAAQL